MRRLAVDVRQSAASTYERPVRVDDDDEVATLGRAFNEAGATVRVQLSEIRAREETLRKFVADTTHDVAIPMSVLQGHLSSLDEALAGRSAPESDARSHLQDAIKETHYMASLLRNLAVATKLGEANAPLAIGPVNLSALVERVIGRHRPIARASRVELDFAVPASPLVQQTDATLLEQAVGNLVDNAIRDNLEGVRATRAHAHEVHRGSSHVHTLSKGQRLETIQPLIYPDPDARRPGRPPSSTRHSGHGPEAGCVPGGLG
jgi:signal transduction histidine kinase